MITLLALPKDGPPHEKCLSEHYTPAHLYSVVADQQQAGLIIPHPICPPPHASIVRKFNTHTIQSILPWINALLLSPSIIFPSPPLKAPSPPPFFSFSLRRRPTWVGPVCGPRRVVTKPVAPFRLFLAAVTLPSTFFCHFSHSGRRRK